MANTLSRAQGEAIIYEMNNLAEEAHASGVSLQTQQRLEERVEKLLQQLKDGGRTYEYTPNVRRPWNLFLLPGEEAAPTINYALARDMLAGYAHTLEVEFTGRTSDDGGGELDDDVAEQMMHEYHGYWQCVQDLYLDVKHPECPDPVDEMPQQWQWSGIAEGNYWKKVNDAAAELDARNAAAAEDDE